MDLAVSYYACALSGTTYCVFMSNDGTNITDTLKQVKIDVGEVDHLNILPYTSARLSIWLLGTYTLNCCCYYSRSELLLIPTLLLWHNSPALSSYSKRFTPSKAQKTSQRGGPKDDKR